MADREKILKILLEYYRASRDSEKRRERMERSTRNNAAFNNVFDFSGKVEGQSTESLPKVATAVESFAAYIKRGLSQYGEWFRVDMVPDSVLSPEDVQALLTIMLHDMPDISGGTKHIEQVISDGAKAGALDSLVILKVRGAKLKAKAPEGIKPEKKDRWRFSIDVMPVEDYFPDPTGRKLYEIHRKQVDLYQIKKAAEQGMYDASQAELITQASKGSHYDVDTYKDQLDRDEAQTSTTAARATADIMEFYGTLVDSGGELLGEDTHAVVGNDLYILSMPKPMKSWCGSPFASGPLIRVPHSVWHRAVCDYISDLNQALNELYNLMFDAGISAVHGVKEIRTSWLEDPGSVQGGIAPQQTIAINEAAPPGVPAIQVARTGGVSGDVMGLYQSLEKEILEAGMTNELRIGQLPPRQVLATEIIQSDQQATVLLDSVLNEYEHVLSEALTKAWYLLMQNLEDVDAGLIIRAVGEEKARELAVMKPDERYMRYVKDARVVVAGLSAISQRSQELRRIIATVATVRGDPLMAQEYQTRLDPRKLFERVFSLAGVDIGDIERTDEEVAAAQQQAMAQQEMMAAQQQGAPGSPAAQGPPGPPPGALPPQIGQLLQ